LTTPKPLST